MPAKTSDLKIAKAFKNDLQKKLKDELVSVILYGSRARGDTWEESDMDLLILLKKEPKHSDKVYSDIIDTEIDYMNKTDIYISSIPYGIRKYHHYKNILPVFYWIKKEGIII
ncbi:MAG: DNA polymerase beta domain-containing protein region [Candidatus Berkelbacteria bacterium Licking1014_85]|uniref:DNA polymerase beta domain-containing protein region n=1 Tax=Candidatus Berkelbacteria bacterium Licking1014_85 TaxID=2017148 RepID=A0A554LHR9_9BACT|nr:MAG: DNA polymerase beta domain-containing protein region [Candidatus Berkelbacteria bacterium Licking1014_85]